MTHDETLIREALAAEAAQAADAEAVRSFLRTTAKAKPTWPRLLVITAAAAAVVLAVVLVPLAFKQSTASAPNQIATQPAPPREDQNILLLGMDDWGTTDTIVLLRARTDGSLRAVSIPRDTMLGADSPVLSPRISGVYKKAYDTAKQSGAPEDNARSTAREAMASTVQKFTGVHANHVVVAQMSAIPRLVDQVGGVEVCVTTATRDLRTLAEFPAGKQTLNGEKALLYLRQRNNLAQADISRIARAQLFLRNLSEKLIAEGFTTDPAKRDALVRTAQEALQVDDGWDLLSFAATFTNPSAIDARTLPYDDPATGLLVLDPATTVPFTEEQLSAQPTSGGGAGGGGAGQPSCVA